MSESNLAPGQNGHRGDAAAGPAWFAGAFRCGVRAGGKAHVWVVEGSPPAVRAVPVQVEPAGGDQLLLRDGLPNGAHIVTAGAHVLQDGQQVRLSSTRG
ncbi:MAG: hypothetical protein R3E68_19485 [Burkholderiaceae bacterium]